MFVGLNMLNVCGLYPLCFHSHDGYKIKYSIGICTILVSFFNDRQYNLMYTFISTLCVSCGREMLEAILSQGSALTLAAKPWQDRSEPSKNLMHSDSCINSSWKGCIKFSRGQHYMSVTEFIHQAVLLHCTNTFIHHRFTNGTCPTSHSNPHSYSANPPALL